MNKIKNGVNHMNISVRMHQAIQAMETHGKLVRYKGGFWSWPNIETKTCRNGSDKYIVPKEFWCDVNTLRALDRRGLVILDEKKKTCVLRKLD